jgi:sortase (surface protein transpeptidase)
MDKFTKINWAKSALFLCLAISLAFIPIIKANDNLQSAKLTMSPATVLPSQTVSLPTIIAKPAEVEVLQPKTLTSSKPVIKELSLTIDAINLRIPLAQTTLDAQGHLQVPANPRVAAWYKQGPVPGGSGTALVTGHLNSTAGPGVFWNLRKLKAGEIIKVGKPDGSIITFQIDKLASYAQDQTFPWDLVYQTTGDAELRIITCDGVYNRSLGHYTKNLVVYAHLIAS